MCGQRCVYLLITGCLIIFYVIFVDWIDSIGMLIFFNFIGE